MSAANKKVIAIIERVLQVQKSSKHVNKHKKSSNINEVIKAVLNFFMFL